MILMRLLRRLLHPGEARRIRELDHAHTLNGRRRALDSGPYDVEAYRAGWFR